MKTKLLAIFALILFFLLAAPLLYGQGTNDTNNSIQILSAKVEPDKVVPGDKLTVTVEVRAITGVKEIVADMGGIENITLQRIAGNIYQGTWQNTWLVHSTEAKNYTVTLFVRDYVGNELIDSSLKFADPIRYEYYNTGEDNLVGVFTTRWIAQTFTVGATSHPITSIKVKLFRSGSSTTLWGTISIRATSSGHPTGADLTSASVDGNSLTSDNAGYWYEFSVSEIMLSANTKYAIVLRFPSGSWVYWKMDSTSPTYAGGNYEYSSNSGSTWTSNLNYDLMFEIWGRKLNGESCSANGDCYSYACKSDYDGVGSWCCYANQCAHDSVCYNPEQTSGNYKCVSGTWTETILPIVTIQSPSNQTYTSTSVWANVTLNQAGSWCGVSLDGAANNSMSNTTGNWNYASMSLSPGTHNVQFFCKDLYGNTGSTTLRYFTINTSGETVLKPANTTFTVKQSIQLVAGIQLQGNTSYLNVYWNASYIVGSGNIQVKCYMNCDPTQTCSRDRNCTYDGAGGIGVCTIINPSYSYDQLNSVYCQFFNPLQPGIPYVDQSTGKPYYRKDFKPVDFSIWLSPLTAVVGTPFDLQTNVKNNGLFDDSFNISVSAYPSNLISIDMSAANTTVGPLKGDSYLNVPETDFSLVKVKVQAVMDNSCICVNVYSTTRTGVLGNFNVDSTNCDQYNDVNKKCVQVKSKISTLPDFGLLGIIQIILLAAAIVYLKFK
jgi:hypothetical protein